MNLYCLFKLTIVFVFFSASIQEIYSSQASDSSPPGVVSKQSSPVLALVAQHQTPLASLGGNLDLVSKEKKVSKEKTDYLKVTLKAYGYKQSVCDHIASFCDLHSGMIWGATAHTCRLAVDKMPRLHSSVTGAIRLPSIGGCPLLVRPFSSLLAPPFVRTENKGGLLPIVRRFLSIATSNITIVSDQFTDLGLITMLSELMQKVEADTKKPLNVQIICGDNPCKVNHRNRAEAARLSKVRKNGIIEALKAAHIGYREITYPEIPASGSRPRKPRMHNKFILIDNFGVLVGSPNASWRAYTTNTETFMAVYSRPFCDVYSAYTRYIIETDGKSLAERTGGGDHSSSLYLAMEAVQKYMNAFNAITACPLKVCLAPIGDIKPFVINNLLNALSIDINMFLVSRASDTSNDVVAILKREGELKRGTGEKTKINLRVDGNAYDKIPDGLCMVGALKALDPNAFNRKLKKPNITIEKIYVENGVMHDKLILVLRSVAGEVGHTVVIGSAGFSDNVQDNYNAENMVSINDPIIYDFFMRHFKLTK